MIPAIEHTLQEIGATRGNAEPMLCSDKLRWCIRTLDGLFGFFYANPGLKYTPTVLVCAFLHFGCLQNVRK